MKRAVLGMALLSLDACAALRGQKPVIEDRLARYSYGSDEPPSVSIAVSTSDVASTAGGIALTSLSDRGQAAMIKQTKGRPPTTIKDDPGGGSVTTRNTVSRHVVIAVRPSGFLAPGDRVDAVRVSLEVAPAAGVKPASWLITSWTQASNGETVIDLGKLTDTNTSKATVSTGLKIAKFLPDLTVGGENDQTKQREIEIKDTTDFDAAVDNDGRAWLDETAGWRQSLAHNLSMDVVLTAPASEMRAKQVVSAGKLSAEDPKHKGVMLPTKATDLRLSEASVYSPVDYEMQPVCGWATLTYRIRHVANGGYTTFSESDDVVQLKTGSSSAMFLFAPPPYKPSYVLRSIDGHVLNYVTANAGAHSLIFASLDDATAFRNWLNQVAPSKGQLANAKIGYNIAGELKPLAADQIRGLTPGLESPAWSKSDWTTACRRTASGHATPSQNTDLSKAAVGQPRG